MKISHRTFSLLCMHGVVIRRQLSREAVQHRIATSPHRLRQPATDLSKATTNHREPPPKSESWPKPKGVIYFVWNGPFSRMNTFLLTQQHRIATLPATMSHRRCARVKFGKEGRRSQELAAMGQKFSPAQVLFSRPFFARRVLRVAFSAPVRARVVYLEHLAQDVMGTLSLDGRWGEKPERKALLFPHHV